MSIGINRGTAFLRNLTRKVMRSSNRVGVASQKIKNPIVTGNSDFALRLHQKIASESKSNVLVSPFGVSTALAMVSGGARGDAATILKKGARFPYENDKLHAGFRELLQNLVGSGQDRNRELSIANALCIQSGNVEERFEALIRNDYDGAVFKGNFQDVNDWVSKKTNGNIQELVEGVLDSVKCIILNAVHLEARWAKEFDPDNTTIKLFHAPHGSVYSLMMNQSNPFRFLKENGFEALELPYNNSSLSMVILLPDETSNLLEFEGYLEPEKLSHTVSHLLAQRREMVDVFLPKFKVESQYSLIPTLNSMGLGPSVFNGDLSGITDSPDFFISDIEHKAVINVDEGGTEASAATAVMVARCLSQGVFNVNRPFLYTIVDRDTESILFMGNVKRPSSWVTSRSQLE